MDEIVLYIVVYIRDFANVKTIFLDVKEILVKLDPSLVNKDYLLVFTFEGDFLVLAFIIFFRFLFPFPFFSLLVENKITSFASSSLSGQFSSFFFDFHEEGKKERKGMKKEGKPWWATIGGTH